MARIQVSNLTFHYEGSFDNIFDNASFAMDTDWKLGLLGRNGKGKTTLLNLLLGNYEYNGVITSPVLFDYFPYSIEEEQMQSLGVDIIELVKPNCEQWRVICELSKLQLDAQVLYQPFSTLSHGERTKVMLAILFSEENEFLLIDEPTNHLDQESREIVKEYLKSKKGFILVSHDRDLLDACIDHVLVLNRCTIEVQSGNFSSWYENKTRKDAFAIAENEKHKKEIKKLETTARRTSEWADANERTKIGFDPIKEHDRFLDTRCHIGAKTKKLQSRVTQIENRISREIKEKEDLLQDIEKQIDLKVMPLNYHKNTLICAKEYGLAYIDNDKVKEDRWILNNINFELSQGERIVLHGQNGCGKSSLIKAILKQNGNEGITIKEAGELFVASGLRISYINQDTSFLAGSIRTFCKERDLEESLFNAILRQLDLDRIQLGKNIEDFSEGQKKKVLIAASLLTPAHLYIWDEPLNYIDVFSRMQIEKLILQYKPSMLIVEHDIRFQEKIATRVVEL